MWDSNSRSHRGTIEGGQASADCPPQWITPAARRRFTGRFGEEFQGFEGYPVPSVLYRLAESQFKHEPRAPSEQVNAHSKYSASCRGMICGTASPWKRSHLQCSQVSTVDPLKWLYHKEDNPLLIFCVSSRDCSSNISQKYELGNLRIFQRLRKRSIWVH
jgi:hypothetical protein